MAVGDKAKEMEGTDPEAAGRRGRTRVPGLLYSVEENPPWHLSILLGLQSSFFHGHFVCFVLTLSCAPHLRFITIWSWRKRRIWLWVTAALFSMSVCYLVSLYANVCWNPLKHHMNAFGQNILTAESSLFSLPILLSGPFCMDQDKEGLVDLIGTMMFVSGIATLLQTSVGVRLPILQGGTASLLVPTLAIMTQKTWACPYTKARKEYGAAVNFTMLNLPEVDSEGHKEIWQLRIREIQGAILVASVVQVVVGFSGAIGIVLRFVGPLAITPTITLIGLSLFPLGQRYCAEHWWIAVMTIFLIALFSQYLRNIKVPCCTLSRQGAGKAVHAPVFNMFPVLLSILIAWGICAILTATDVFPDDPNKWGYMARTDRSDILQRAKWFRFPYPGQWGTPTVSVSSTLGILAGIVSSMIESVGDYYACARLAGAPPPPSHAINRGIGIEGICSILAGAWGSGNGTTSFSQNVGVIGITKVGSRRVLLLSGVMLLILGCMGKFAAVFVSIPGAVIGGLFVVAFGMIVAVGLSNLQFVDMNSGRNVFIVGVAIFFGLTLPTWMAQNNGAINTGSDVVDQILHVLLSTSMFVGGLIGFVLDNTIPGTDEERGIKKWRQLTPEQQDSDCLHVYDISYIQKYLDKVALFRYLPFCPSSRSRSRSKTGHVIAENGEVMSNSIQGQGQRKGQYTTVNLGNGNTKFESDMEVNNTEL